MTNGSDSTGHFDAERNARRTPAVSRSWSHRMVTLCRKVILSLPGSQPFVLRQIERSLLAGDARLDSDFAIFTRSTRRQKMPPAEQIPHGAGRYGPVGRRRQGRLRGKTRPSSAG